MLPSDDHHHHAHPRKKPKTVVMASRRLAPEAPEPRRECKLKMGDQVEANFNGERLVFRVRIIPKSPSGVET